MFSKQSQGFGLIRKLTGQRKKLVPVVLAIFMLTLVLPLTAGAVSGGQIDVKSFGAKGDGFTDDTVAVQKAINSATTGDTLIFNGTFSVSSLSVNGKTDIGFGGSGTIKSRSDNALIRVTSSPGFRLKGLTFDGNTRNGYLVDIQNSGYFAFEGNTFKNVGNGTKMVAAVYIAPNCNNGLFKGNVVENLVADRIARGVWVCNFRSQSQLSTNIIITENLFRNIRPSGDADGIVIEQGGNSNITISSNTFQNVHKRAVKVMANAVKVSNNTVTRNNIGQGFAALSAYGNNVTIENNSVIASGNSNYYWLVDIKGNGVKILNNHLENSASANNAGVDGVSIDALLAGATNFSNITISGNTIKNVRYGIRNVSTAPVNGLTISGNKIYGATNTVINFDSKVDNPTITLNYSAPSPIYFIKFSANPVNANIQENTANAKNGFYIITSGGTPINSTIRNNTNNGVKVPDLITASSPAPAPTPESDPAPGDTTPPKAAAWDPVVNSVDVAVDKSVTATFDENIQTGSTYDGIKLTDSSGTSVALNKTISGTKLTITPAVKLAHDTKYELWIPKSAVRDMVGNDLSVDYLLPFTTEKPADITPPKAAAWDPGVNSVDVAVDKSVTATFDENIQAGSTYDGIKLTDSSGTSVALNKTISGNKLTLTPTEKLAHDTKYELWIPKSAVRDMVGNNLSVDYLLPFTSEKPADITPPKAAGWDPADFSVNVPVDKSVTVTFDENIQTGSTYDGIKLTDPSGTSVALNKTISGTKLTIAPAVKLAQDTKYELWIPASAVSDMAGNNLRVDYILEFTTEKPADTTPPKAISWDPADFSINIPVDKAITVTFNEDILAGSTYDGIKLTNPRGNSVSLNKSISGNKLILTPATKLAAGTKYELWIPASAVKDKAGNNLKVDYILEFTTQK